jgi:hypothetical protein
MFSTRILLAAIWTLFVYLPADAAMSVQGFGKLCERGTPQEIRAAIETGVDVNAQIKGDEAPSSTSRERRASVIFFVADDQKGVSAIVPAVDEGDVVREFHVLADVKGKAAALEFEVSGATSRVRAPRIFGFSIPDENGLVRPSTLPVKSPIEVAHGAPFSKKIRSRRRQIEIQRKNGKGHCRQNRNHARDKNLPHRFHLLCGYD